MLSLLFLSTPWRPIGFYAALKQQDGYSSERPAHLTKELKRNDLRPAARWFASSHPHDYKKEHKNPTPTQTPKAKSRRGSASPAPSATLLGGSGAALMNSFRSLALAYLPMRPGYGPLPPASPYYSLWMRCIGGKRYDNE